MKGTTLPPSNGIKLIPRTLCTMDRGNTRYQKFTIVLSQAHGGESESEIGSSD